MIIGVLSDTHGDLRATDRAFQLFRRYGAKVVFHLGDGNRDVQHKDIEYDMEVITVAGNLDYGTDAPMERVFQTGHHRFFLCHGHNLEVHNTNYYLLQRAREEDCQIALHGHSHIPYNVTEEGILILNPGSVAIPKGNSKASAAIIRTNGKVNAQIYWLWEPNCFSARFVGRDQRWIPGDDTGRKARLVRR